MLTIKPYSPTVVLAVIWFTIMGIFSLNEAISSDHHPPKPLAKLEIISIPDGLVVTGCKLAPGQGSIEIPADPSTFANPIVLKLVCQEGVIKQGGIFADGFEDTGFVVCSQ